MRNILRGQNRLSVDQNHVAADLQSWIGEGQFDGFVCGRGLCHEGRAGEQAVAMELDDSAVDTRGQAEVVGVHDESLHLVECTNLESGNH